MTSNFFLRIIAILVINISLAGIARATLFEQSELPAPNGKVNHGQAIIETTSGSLLDCWYSGSSEAGEDSQILCSWSQDKGLTWSQPQTIVHPHERAIGAHAANKSVGNVTLYYDTAGRLWMIYGVIQHTNIFCTNWKCGRVDGKFSTDSGHTWSTAVRLDNRNGALVRAQPLHVDGLGDLLPLYLETKQKSSIVAMDLGSTPDGVIPKALAFDIPMNKGDGLIQPVLVQRPDSQLIALMRDAHSKSIFVSAFDSERKIWSTATATNLPNPNSAIDAKIDTDGQIIVLYNPSTSLRNSLKLASSSDGFHFQTGCDLVPVNTQGDVAYPTLIHANDDTWHVTYSSHNKQKVEHIRFDNAWLKDCLSQ
jgi:predicted neuraminidase